jgi:adenylyl- and sulfurtransferase ThiI
LFTDKLKGKELMKEIILLKDGEIVLKGLNRRTFEDVLKKNIRHAISHLGSFEIKSAQSILYEISIISCLSIPIRGLNTSKSAASSVQLKAPIV